MKNILKLSKANYFFLNLKPLNYFAKIEFINLLSSFQMHGFISINLFSCSNYQFLILN